MNIYHKIMLTHSKKDHPVSSYSTSTMYWINSKTKVHSELDGINVILCSLELGAGWEATILETRDEYNFIRQSQRGCSSDIQDYFIGGSACPGLVGSFDYYSRGYFSMSPAYSTSQTGCIASKNISNLK